ncbi:MAG TPA: TauD/TfdA family dioxygenase [Ktedonobacteraceae bacterium]|nr:TauD/TfdA family dioxygenase [Ktedonobacteraceae bacterium]
MERQKHQSSRMGRLKSVKPKAVEDDLGNFVTLRLLDDHPLPLLIEPRYSDVDLSAWLQNQRQVIEEKLLQHGAILFRGFHIQAAAEFEQVALALCPELFGEYGDLPRSGISNNVYSSTPYPADQAILFHNESSHLHRWPLKQWFCCLKAAQQGGETPIVDCREVYQNLAPETIAQFTHKQLMYVRNFTPGLDVSWQSFFQTSDKSEVETACQKEQVLCEWLEADQLQTRQIRPAIAQHPKTQQMLFFNQMQVHHPFYLEPTVRNYLLSSFGKQRLPRNVYYGDGSEIAEETLQEIIDVYWRLARKFAWQEGDILLIDNMLVAHGRLPFTGQRQIVVAMGDMFSARAI